MSTKLHLLDHPTRDDLRVYLERLQKSGQPEVRLVVRDSVLAVFGCTQAPAGLTDPVPVVLTLRTFTLRGDSEVGAEIDDPDTVETSFAALPVDVVVLGRSLLERIARMGPLGRTLDVPDVTTTAAWAGILPPHSGWQHVGEITGASLRQVAAEGIARVAAALPTDPGEAIVRTARASVWGLAIAPGVPAAAAFAGEALGFFADENEVRISRTLTWTRLRSTRGDVLVRNFAG